MTSSDVERNKVLVLLGEQIGQIARALRVARAAHRPLLRAQIATLQDVGRRIAGNEHRLEFGDRLRHPDGPEGRWLGWDRASLDVGTSWAWVDVDGLDVVADVGRWSSEREQSEAQQRRRGGA